MRTDFLHKSADATSMAEEVIRSQGAMALKVAATDPEYLEGTYSKAFVSEMAIQLTSEIESRMLVCGLSKSDIALEMIFAPGTYFEHPQGEYTYRRLLISENGRAIKDLWVRWHRVGEGENFTVCDAVSPDEIRFSLGEDVPQKVREKEYRFLVRADAEKYRSAMGRKNVTEWREIIKRALKRGALQKLTIDDKVAEHAEQIKDKLEELLGKMTPAPMPESVAPAPSQETDEEYEKAMAYMRSFVEGNKVQDAAEEEQTEWIESSDASAADSAEEIESREKFASEETPVKEDSELAMDEPAEEPQSLEATPDIVIVDEPLIEMPAAIEAEDGAVANEPEQLVIEVEDIVIVDEPSAEEFGEKPASAQIPSAQTAAPAIDLEAMRAEMEAKLRAEMAAREQALLQKEQELEQQRRAFAAEIKEQESGRVERENELRRQAQHQARLEWEAKERDRLAAQAQEAIERRKAEEARLVEEARKAEEARLAEEARKAEEARLAEEARKAEEARLAEEARKAEEARLAEEARKAEEARLAEEARKAEEARLAEEARKAEEARLAEEARKAEEARLAEEAQREADREAEPYTYTEKLVHLIFRYPVDPNVLTRIQELMTETIRYFKKENVFIKVKASIPAEDKVDLHFTQFPEQEHQLLVDMIQVLGNSDLGICRVRVE